VSLSLQSSYRSDAVMDRRRGDGFGFLGVRRLSISWADDDRRGVANGLARGAASLTLSLFGVANGGNMWLLFAGMDSAYDDDDLVIEDSSEGPAELFARLADRAERVDFSVALALLRGDKLECIRVLRFRWDLPSVSETDSGVLFFALVDLDPRLLRGGV